ncbi:NirD/YgiW/YdeI family stress tolerance protein [Cronobacter sakazakii]|nr:NirD/YgiW/YdeI family stress tolerance protein [Enterobacter roggenkampii MGH 34]EKY3146476.1 NirD/YgiW/YdeI family stress tolerance protein [Cronobacter sakazakii]MBT0345235.1 NirD/YgiW/YdeI family stress tolerance protein [Morganella morganii subsp. morganii]QIO38343.1 NirD/YgiW/YdeI family stress tolerance protein [Citrobacter sp. Y3]SAD56730.1 nickel-resistant pritein NcrY [Enterobacter roggenkampii]HED3005749.1 NirD/YgiW/YdeI family stress tolerance protein [Citrobacter freundii]
MQKQYFSQIRRQFFNVTGMLLTSFIAIPALAAQGGFSAEKEPVVTERMYAGHKVQQENGQSRIQAVPSMREGAWVTLEGNVISQQQEEWYTFRDPTGTIKVRIQQKVWNGQHFDAQDLVRVSGKVSHENGSTILDVAVISKP